MKPKYIQALGGVLLFVGSFLPWATSPYGFSIGLQHFSAIPTLLGAPLILAAATVAPKAPGARGSWLASLLGLLALLYMGYEVYVLSQVKQDVGLWVCLLGGLLAFAGGWIKNPGTTPESATPSPQVKTSDALRDKGESKPARSPIGIIIGVLSGAVLLLIVLMIQGLSRMGQRPPPPTPAPYEVTAAAQARETRVAPAKAVVPSLARETGLITSPFRQIDYYTSHAYIYFDETRLWVAYAAELLALDPESREVVLGPINLTGDVENMIFDGNQLWVSQYGGNNLIPIDVISGKLGPAIKVAVSPGSLAYDGNLLWVYAEYYDKQWKPHVQAIDPVSRQVLPPVMMEGKGNVFEHFPDKPRQVLWILSSQLKVLQYDLQQNALRDTPLQFGYHILSHFDGQRLWMINKQGFIQSIDVDTGETTNLSAAITTTIVSSIPSGKQIWLGSQDWTVQSIDLTTGQLGTAIPVFGLPSDLEFDGRRLWIALYDEGSDFVGLQYIIPN